MQKITITDTFSMTNWPEMDSFFTINHHPGYVMRNRKLFEWQFSGGGHMRQANMLCAFAQDSLLVGILGYMPLDVFWGNFNAPIRAVWMANLMVKPDFRHGTGTLMMRRLMEIYPVLMGQGAGDMNIPIASAMGFHIYDGIPRYISIFNADKMGAFVTAPDFRMPGSVDDFDIHPAVCHELPQDYDPDWSLYPMLAFGTVRSASYLRWRYVNHPIFKYEVLVMGMPTQPAICVFRIEDTKGAIRSRVGRIVEFFHPQTENGESEGVLVLHTALAKMIACGCVFADFYCTSELLASTLAKAGMNLATNDPIANRMSPVELRHYRQNLEVWASPGMSFPSEPGNYYVTKSDGDQDRPN